MILDAHTHLLAPSVRSERDLFFDGEPDFKLLYKSEKARLISGDELVEAMDIEGVDASCAFGFPWNDVARARENNDYVLECAENHPGRIIPFCCVQPLTGAASLREVERALVAGALGVGEIASYNAGLGEEVRRLIGPLAELCGEADVPLLLHTNEPLGHEYPGKSAMEVGQVYRLIKAHPRTKWILAHWGGGLFSYGLLKKEVDQTLANVWFDTAAGPFLYKPKVYRSFIDAVGVDRLLFGSDYPLLPLSRYKKDMIEVGLTEAEMDAILGANLANLLGLVLG